MNIKTIACFVLLLLFTACSGASIAGSNAANSKDHSALTPYPSNAAYIFDPMELSEIEAACGVIVKGRFGVDTKTDMQQTPDGARVAYGSTISPFAVSNVIKGDLEVGQIIDIVEPYYIENNKAIHFLGYYYPSDKNREYIMFLDIQPEGRFYGMYSPCGREKGRYPLSDVAENANTAPNRYSRSTLNIESMSDEQLNLAKGDSTLYRSIYAEVIEKYMGAEDAGASSEHSLLTSHPVPYSMVKPPSLTDLEQNASDIVVGRFIGESEAKAMELPGNGRYRYSISDFEVDKAYTGNLQPGDSIKVYEPYYILDNEIVHIGNYYPSDVGRDYLLFMVQYPPEQGGPLAGLYWPYGYEYGRFAVVDDSRDASSFSNGEMDLGEGDAEAYRVLYSEVIEKYMS